MDIGTLIVCSAASLFMSYLGWRADDRPTVIFGACLLAITWALWLVTR